MHVLDHFFMFCSSPFGICMRPESPGTALEPARGDMLDLRPHLPLVLRV